MKRSHEFEAEATRGAARQLGVPWDDVHRMASRRADERGQDFITEGRDFGLEGMEESADGVNYACWWLLLLTVQVRNGRITEQDFEESQFDVNNALAHSAAAFFYFQRARDRLVG